MWLVLQSAYTTFSNILTYYGLMTNVQNPIFFTLVCQPPTHLMLYKQL